MSMQPLNRREPAHAGHARVDDGAVAASAFSDKPGSSMKPEQALSHEMRAPENQALMLPPGLSSLRFERFGHSNEIREGSRLHFPHNRAPMNFHRDFAYSEIVGYLLVHLAVGHQPHHLQFTGGKRPKPLSGSG